MSWIFAVFEVLYRIWLIYKNEQLNDLNRKWLFFIYLSFRNTFAFVNILDDCEEVKVSLSTGGKTTAFPTFCSNLSGQVLSWYWSIEMK